MLQGLLLLHFIAGVALIIFSSFSFRRGVTLLNTFVPFFVICCCLGVNFFEYFAEFLPPFQYSNEALVRVIFANLIFMGCSAVAIQVQSRMLRKKDGMESNMRVISTSPEVRWAIMLASILVSLFLGSWFLDVSAVEDPFAAYKETGGSGQYYKYRQMVDEDVVATSGRGSWTAKKLALNVGPFLMILLAYMFYQTRNWVYLGLFAVQTACGILVAGILAHKSYLLVTVFSPILAIMVWKLRGISFRIFAPLLAGVLLVGGTFIFQATLNSTFGFAFGGLITRAFLVPAFTPTFYYEVIPDALPFRGILESLYIEHIRAPSWDYSIYDVAYHATGRAYGANANFLAVAYTGSGFLGVLWVSLLCLGLVLLVDYYLADLEPNHRIVAVCCSGFGFIGITSIHFLGSVANGFLIGSLLFIALCRARVNAPEASSDDDPLVLDVGEVRA
jgi:hypothetical protein